MFEWMGKIDFRISNRYKIKSYLPEMWRVLQRGAPCIFHDMVPSIMSISFAGIDCVVFIKGKSELNSIRL